MKPSILPRLLSVLIILLFPTITVKAQLIGISTVYTVPTTGYGGQGNGGWQNAGGVSIHVDKEFYSHWTAGFSFEYAVQRQGAQFRTRMFLPSVRLGYLIVNETSASLSPFIKFGFDYIHYITESRYFDGSRRSARSIEPGIELSVQVVGGFSVRGQLAFHVVRDHHGGFIRNERPPHPRILGGPIHPSFSYGVYRIGLQYKL